MSESTKASDWFETEVELLQLCGDAQSQAQSETSQEFTADMVIKAKKYGLQMFLTPRQLNYLCTLADWEIPARVKRN